MRLETTKIYTYDELSDSAKDKAISDLNDINMESGFWFEHISDELLDYGAYLLEFDINRGEIGIDFGDCGEFAIKVMENHGKHTDTYVLSMSFLKDLLIAGDDDTIEETSREYTNAMSQEYLKMLRVSYEYATSDESIVETILANEYEFLESGEMY
jgi:hypothetical protein